MKIDSMKISNFRGYAENTEIKFNDLTVFVGKNDMEIDSLGSTGYFF